MGLDIYVGPLCRYYGGNWETVIQKYGREAGIPTRMLRPKTDGAITDPAEVLAITEMWRTSLCAQFREHGVVVTWQEDPRGTYSTDKPGWEPYRALLLWAFYLEHPELDRPAEFPERWEEEPVFIESRREGFSTKFPHLLLDTEFWIPGDFDFVFEATTPAGDQVRFGSALRLRDELRSINEASWRGCVEDLSVWRWNGWNKDSPWETWARFCCAVMENLAAASVRDSLPMKLDY
jgi:hypothetical protein